MKIELMKLSMDAESKVVGNSLEPFAAVVGDKAEMLQSNAIQIVGLLWLKKLGVFQAEAVVGSYDSTNTFRENRQYNTALISWSREQYPELWAKYGLDNLTFFDLETVAFWLYNEGAFEKAGIDVWKVPEPGVRLKSDADVVLQDYRPQAIDRIAKGVADVKPIGPVEDISK